MNITHKEAKTALDQGRTLIFVYVGGGRYVSANYHAYRNERGDYLCDVHYEGEGERREPQWGSKSFDEFVQHLPRPAMHSDAWQIDTNHAPATLSSLDPPQDPGGLP